VNYNTLLGSSEVQQVMHTHNRLVEENERLKGSIQELQTDIEDMKVTLTSEMKLEQKDLTDKIVR